MPQNTPKLMARSPIRIFATQLLAAPRNESSIEIPSPSQIAKSKGRRIIGMSLIGTSFRPRKQSVACATGRQVASLAAKVRQIHIFAHRISQKCSHFWVRCARSPNTGGEYGKGAASAGGGQLEDERTTAALKEARLIAGMLKGGAAALRCHDLPAGDPCAPAEGRIWPAPASSLAARTAIGSRAAPIPARFRPKC